MDGEWGGYGMTEKRFELAYCDYDWWAICDNENNKELHKELGLSGQEVVDLMNEINDENKELKRLIKKVMDERVVDYPLLRKLKKMVEE